MGVKEKVGTDNRGRDAETKTNNKNRRYFGLISADIDHKNKRVELRFTPRYREPISDQVRIKCLSWAMASLEPYRRRGYIFETPEAVPSG